MSVNQQRGVQNTRDYELKRDYDNDDDELHKVAH